MTTPQEKLQGKLDRIHKAVALQEPDRIPIINPCTNTFYAADSGFTMAETLYDYSKARQAIKTYLERYDTDSGILFPSGLEGQGPLLERAQAKAVIWAGGPDGKVTPEGVHQFIEFELMEDDEIAELLENFEGFVLQKYLPRAYGLMSPLQKLKVVDSFQMSMHALGLVPLGAFAADPETKAMMEGLADIAASFGQLMEQVGAWAVEQETQLGFPVMCSAPEVCAFDFYSDFMRGTMSASEDLYSDPEMLDEFLHKYCDLQIARFKANPGQQPGRIMFMPMHKGMDTFLSDEHYGQYYWKHLLRLVNTWVDAGMIPYVYTEGHYDSRIEYLKQLPKGKCIIHFEFGDPAKIKKELGDIACLSGIYPAELLERGTKQQVIDKAKELIDIMAPGGGYLFDVDGGIYDTTKRENWEALLETVKTYGSY